MAPFASRSTNGKMAKPIKPAKRVPSARITAKAPRCGVGAEAILITITSTPTDNSPRNAVRVHITQATTAARTPGDGGA